MANDCIKECRAFQYPAGSTSDCLFQVQHAEGPESYTSDIERQLGVAQHQKQLCQLKQDTSPGDSQKDVTSDSIVTGNDDNDRQQKRRLQLAADDRRELPSDACQSLISRYAETSEYNRAALPPARPETDKKERRYSIDRHDADDQSHVIVQSAWLETFQSEYSDAYEKRFIRDIQDTDLPPGIEQQQHIVRTEAETDALSLNESIDLFPSDSQQIASTTGNSTASCTAFCIDPLVHSISENTNERTMSSINSASSLLLLPFSMATGSTEEVRSSRETASPPCMAVTTTGCLETTATVSTCNTCEEKTHEDLQTRNSIVSCGSNHVSSKSEPTTVKPHIANTLLTPAVDRKKVVKKKKGNEVSASISASSATKIKCHQNSNYNIKCTGTEEQQQNCQQTKILTRRPQDKPEIIPQSELPRKIGLRQIPEIVAKCEESARECKEALENMHKMLRKSRMEKFLQQWTLQEMGFHISQSEYNAPVIPESVRERRSRETHAAYAHRDRVFTPKSGNIKSTKQLAESAHSWSSPPACARTPGLTSCQARGSYDKHAVKGNTPMANIHTRPTAFMPSPARSSFQSSHNSSFQNYTRRLPAVCMARTKQTARKVRDDRQRGRARQPEKDRRREWSSTLPRRARPRSPSPDRLKCVFCGLISHQRRNHRRHLIIKHNCRPDGTPATAADIEEAKRDELEPPTGRNARYKSHEFIESHSDKDTTTTIGSGASTPSERRSPSPSRIRRQKKTRSESSGSSSPQRDTRHVVSRQPAAPSPTTSRAAMPPRSAPPVRKQVRKVRFKKGKTTETEDGSTTATQKKPVKPPARAKKPTTATRKDKKAKVEEQPKAEIEIQPTPSATTSAQRLKNNQKRK